MMGDILKEDERRLDLADDAGDMRPEVAWIIAAEPSACDGKRLARVACAKKIHRAAPRAAIEGSNVIPDNSLIQGRVRGSLERMAFAPHSIRATRVAGA